MSIFAPAAPPKTALGRYRLLSPNAGVHVSPLQLGGMSIGDKWEVSNGMGSMGKKSSFELLDAYYDNGGNFIDTSCNYQDETSEKFIGEWAEQRGIRDQLFIATKFSANFKASDPSYGQKILLVGNGVKAMKVSVTASLKKLRTTYIDLLYVHWWDFETSIPEVMRGLHNLVQQGIVLYLGISDSPAWVVAQANEYARCNSLTPFSVYQGAWNVLDRSFEREIIPMARANGLALAPWNVLAGGKLRTDVEEERRRDTGEKGRTMMSPQWERNETEKAVSRALEKVAEEVGAKSITSVAIAYLLHKTPYVFPIVGGRKIEQMLQNIEALDISLSAEQIKFLEDTVPFDLGFPGNFIGTGDSISSWFASAGIIDKQPLPMPINPVGRA